MVEISAYHLCNIEVHSGDLDSGYQSLRLAALSVGTERP